MRSRQTRTALVIRCPEPIDTLVVQSTAVLDRITFGHTRRLTRFGLVGIIGVMVNTAVLYLLVEGGHLNHLVAAAISSEVSILTNFVLNDLWTFSDATSECSWIRRAGRYNAVALSGMTISLAMLAALTSLLGLHYLVANLIAIAAATLSNYALNNRFTWNRTPELVPVIAE